MKKKPTRSINTMSNPKLVSIIDNVNSCIEKAVQVHKKKEPSERKKPLEIVIDLGPDPTFRGEAIAYYLHQYSFDNWSARGRYIYVTHDILFDLSAQTHWIKIELGTPCTAQFIKIVIDKVPIK